MLQSDFCDHNYFVLACYYLLSIAGVVSHFLVSELGGDDPIDTKVCSSILQESCVDMTERANL